MPHPNLKDHRVQGSRKPATSTHSGQPRSEMAQAGRKLGTFYGNGEDHEASPACGGSGTGHTFSVRQKPGGGGRSGGSGLLLRPCILIWVGFLSLVWLMFVAYYSFHIIETLSPNTSLHPQNIIVLAGQSNVFGRGGVVNGTWEGDVPPECEPNPSILRLSAALRWEEAREPLHRDIDVDKTCGVGPGMPFSNSILKGNPSAGVIGLVPCAIGGTNISEWRRSSRLYNQLIYRARAAVNGGGVIRAVLWYQGETDTIDLDNANLYKSRLEELFTDLRSDLMSPMLPVILVALASGEGSHVDVIRKAQLEIDVPNVKIVDAMGLQLQPDGLHLTTAAQVRLGPMLADAFLKITASSEL